MAPDCALIFSVRLEVTLQDVERHNKLLRAVSHEVRDGAYPEMLQPYAGTMLIGEPVTQEMTLELSFQGAMYCGFDFPACVLAIVERDQRGISAHGAISSFSRVEGCWGKTHKKPAILLAHVFWSRLTPVFDSHARGLSQACSRNIVRGLDCPGRSSPCDLRLGSEMLLPVKTSRMCCALDVGTGKDTDAFSKGLSVPVSICFFGSSGLEFFSQLRLIDLRTPGAS